MSLPQQQAVAFKHNYGGRYGMYSNLLPKIFFRLLTQAEKSVYIIQTVVVESNS